MHRTVSLAALLVAGLRSAALAAPDPDPLTVKHLTVAEARRLVAVQDAKPEFPGLERYCDACDGLVAVGGSPDVVAAMRQAARLLCGPCGTIRRHRARRWMPGPPA